MVLEVLVVAVVLRSLVVLGFLADQAVLVGLAELEVQVAEE